MNDDIYMRYSRPVQMVLALLKHALSGGEVCHDVFAGATDADWQACHRLAVEQGVMAMAWEGVAALPADLLPPRALKLTWAMAVEKYEERYAHYCRTVHELTELLRPHGIGLMQLKGVGFSTHYPVPAHREGGDIDVRLYSLDTTRMSDEEALALAEKLMEERGIEVDREHSKKHNTFRYRGIMIENHKAFLNVYNTHEAVPLEKYLHEHSESVEVALLGGEYPISVPSDAFNAVFIGFHAAQHYGSGLSLHHLCDWACLMKDGAWGLLPTELMAPRVQRFFCALTGLAHRYLGIPVEVEFDEAFAEEMLHEMVAPAYPSVPATAFGNNPIRIFVYKFRRLYHNSCLRGQVFDTNFMSRLWLAVKNNYWRPARLFRVTWDK